MNTNYDSPSPLPPQQNTPISNSNFSSSTPEESVVYGQKPQSIIKVIQPL